MDEKWFQKRILMAAEEENCHAFKNTEMFAMGRPDLYIKHPKFGSGVWVELKFSPALAKGGIPINMTPLQRRFLEKEQEAGGKSMWIVGVPSKDDMFVSIVAGIFSRLEVAGPEHFVQTIRTRPKIEPINLYGLLSVAFA